MAPDQILEETCSVRRIIDEICEDSHIDIHQWNIVGGNDDIWLHFQRISLAIPAQGWKLHISAHHASAEAVLRSTLPLLLAEAVHFKVVGSLKLLHMLNRGEAGPSQVGKFITIYPQDDEEAVHLASKLDQATSGMKAPAIPSDRPLRPGSVVHYRYGSFHRGLYIQSPNGEILPAIRTPANELIPDPRSLRYSPPSWCVDPFLAAGVATALPAPARMISERYMILVVVASSLNHALYLALDLEEARSCVIKGPGYAWQYASETYEHLRREANMLARLATDPRIPTFYDLVEQDGKLFLIMQDIEGETLDIWLARRKKFGPLPLQQIIAWAVELAEILSVIHDQGIIYADIKSSNIMIGPQNQIYLIDFELSQEQGEEKRKGTGTPGYVSGQRWAGRELSFQDDIYGLGALLYFLVTGAEPSASPDPDRLFVRPLELLRSDIPESLKALITRCLCDDPAQTFSSMHELRAALQAPSCLAETPGPTLTINTAKNESSSSAYYQELARQLLQTLCATAQRPEEGDGLAWVSIGPAGKLIRRDLYTGCSGTLLALAELAQELTEPLAFSVLKQGTDWLQQAPVMNSQPLPGLYVGEAGVGTALLRAGQVLHDDTLIHAAARQGKLVASLPHISPDLMNGTAGRLRFHLLLWHETGEREHLLAAQTCANALLKRQYDQAGYWRIPEGYGGLSGEAYLGYAHGAAGIADALLDLFVATSDERLLSIIQKVGSWLREQALPALEDKSGLTWPLAIGKAEIANPFWCHGATGIGRFFLNAREIVLDAREIAERAAMTVTSAARWIGPTQCHGLSGSIEFLLDTYQATGNRTYYEEALSLGSLLEAFATEQRDLYMFSGETRHHFSPDYMSGYAGIALCLLRLSTPEHIPHQLSQAGFRYRGESRLSLQTKPQPELVKEG